jgi:hypothetical protein
VTLQERVLAKATSQQHFLPGSSAKAINFHGRLDVTTRGKYDILGSHLNCASVGLRHFELILENCNSAFQGISIDLLHISPGRGQLVSSAV